MSRNLNNSKIEDAEISPDPKSGRQFTIEITNKERRVIPKEVTSVQYNYLSADSKLDPKYTTKGDFKPTNDISLSQPNIIAN